MELLVYVSVPALIVVVLYLLLDRLPGRSPDSVEKCPACGATPAGDTLYCADCLADSHRRK